MGQNWSAVFLQKFEGTVTIWPKSRGLSSDCLKGLLALTSSATTARDWLRILTDPDRDEFARLMRVGQTVTWPKIKMIANRMKIERALDAGREAARQQLSAGATTPHLMHRLSSDDTLSRHDVERDRDSPLMDDTAVDSTDDSGDNEGQNVELGGRNEPSLSPRPAAGSEADAIATRRRKQILQRLGLSSARIGSDSPSDSDTEPDPRRRRRANETNLRRRLSLGTLQLGQRIRGKDGLLGHDTDTEEDSDDAPEGGWHPTGRGRLSSHF